MSKKLKNKIGVMQGRLLKKYKNQYQAHPVGYWFEEFALASKLGLDLIEFIFDINNPEDNPLITKDGNKKILDLIEKNNVDVKTVCADYFMQKPIHSEDAEEALQSQKLLEKLILYSSNLGVTDIIIPCIESSSLRSSKLKEKFLNVVSNFYEMLEELNVNLSLETDLNPKEFSTFINCFSSKKITINYDVGNSAHFGYDVDEELSSYGDKITDIHIKDRVLGGFSVPLGTGDSDFNKFFLKLRDINYQGPLIMQAYRDDDGIKIFAEQLEWVKRKILEISHEN